MRSLFHIRTPEEKEVKRRVSLSVAAWAYEIGVVKDATINSHMTDSEFDLECRKVDLSISTSRPDLDVWWRENFTPDTGSWIWDHPEREKLEKLYYAFYNPERRGNTQNLQR